MRRSRTIHDLERRLLARESEYRVNQIGALVFAILSLVAIPVVLIVGARLDVSLAALVVALIANAVVWSGVAIYSRARLQHIASIWHRIAPTHRIIRRPRKRHTPRASGHTPSTPLQT